MLKTWLCVLRLGSSTLRNFGYELASPGELVQETQSLYNGFLLGKLFPIQDDCENHVFCLLIVFTQINLRVLMGWGQ